MPSKYWIKLYHEILDDPKMGRLSDSVWRRCIEIFLLAGELDNDGLLMPTEDIAWRIRIPVSQLEEELTQLESVGVLQRTEDGSWVVTHFKKRQSAVNGTERTRQFRRRQAQKSNEDQASPPQKSRQNGPDPSGSEVTSEKGEAPAGDGGGVQRSLHVTNQERKCNASVTQRYTQNVDTDTDTDTDSESLSPPESNLNLPHARETAGQAAASAKQLTAELIPLYQLSKKQAETLCQSLVEEFSLGRHPPETIKQAYQKALRDNRVKRPGPYARAILNDWAEIGTGPPETNNSHSEVKNGNGNGQHPDPADVPYSEYWDVTPRKLEQYIQRINRLSGLDVPPLSTDSPPH